LNFNIFSGGTSSRCPRIYDQELTLWLAAYSAAVDFALALLPWKLLLGLRLRRAEKLGAAIALSMGVL